jgi:hypothetical protein
MRLYDEVRGAGARIFPDGKVKQGEDVYIYSTSWRMTLPPFCFYPWTTVAPINRDFSKSSILPMEAKRAWNACFFHPFSSHQDCA